MQIRDRIKDLRRVKASTLRPDPKNWRTHPKAQADALRGILAEVGYVDALMARELPDGSLQLVDGHLRAETTPDMEVPVLVVDLNDEEAAKVLTTFDPLSAMAESNKEQLKSLLQSVETQNAELGKLLEQIAQDNRIELAEKAPGGGGDDFDTAPKEGPTRVQKGELWVLGEHRLLCGDSASAGDVKRLMGAERASLLVTDPPYNLSANWNGLQTFRGNEQVANDDMGADWFQWAEDVLQTLKDHALSVDCSCYWWHCMEFNPRREFKAMGFSFNASIVWVKEHFNVGRADYHSQYEPCLYFSQGKRYWCGRRDLSDIWDARRVEELRQHPTQKPLSIISKCIENSSVHGDLILDGFCGSGTTLIAAERLGRRCFAMEIEPRYCDVILARWEAETGKKAELQK